jgi:hypothetical protein
MTTPSVHGGGAASQLARNPSAGERRTSVEFYEVPIEGLSEAEILLDPRQ